MILSARSDLPTKLRGFELGANDYVVKPFSIDELIARIRVQLRHAAGLLDDHVVHAGRRVDLSRRQVRIGDDVTGLWTGEFRLLKSSPTTPGK